MARLNSTLRPGEHTRLILRGGFDGSLGLLCLTDQRLLFVGDFLGAVRTEEVPFDTIHSVGSGKGWVFSEITINTPTNNIHFGEPRPRWLAEEFVNLLLESRAAPNATQKEAVVADGDQTLGQLRQLAELHAAGVLTDDEFAQKKAELLKRI